MAAKFRFNPSKVALFMGGSLANPCDSFRKGSFFERLSARKTQLFASFPLFAGQKEQIDYSLWSAKNGFNFQINY